MLIDGRAIAATLRQDLQPRVAALKAAGLAPRLDVVLIGDNPASEIYVGMKQKAAQQAGIASHIHRLPADTTQNAALDFIAALNTDAVHGILLQLPVPPHLDALELLNAIAPSRDVDGLTMANVARRTIGLPALLPCTPKGCVKLIKSVRGDDLHGLVAAVIGRSDLVGKPMAQLLLREGCTVMQLHKQTRDPAFLCHLADIVVVAAGQPRLVTADWIKSGATVIDVGISRLDGEIVGDVDYSDIREKAGAITPVPGGVGPMTVACLLENLVEAAEASIIA